MREIITIQVGQTGNSIGEKVRVRSFETRKASVEHSSGNLPAMNMGLLPRGCTEARVICNSNESMFISPKREMEVLFHDRFLQIWMTIRSIE